MSFIKDIEKRFRRLQEEDLEEMSVTGGMDGGEGPPKTPKAFSKRKEDENDTAEVGDIKKVGKISKRNFAAESTYKKMMGQMHLSEVSYKEYKKDESSTAKQKVNSAISEINRRLFEIERIVSQNVKLKQEMGVNNGQYWKSSKSKLAKISERILKVAKQFRDLSA